MIDQYKMNPKKEFLKRRFIDFQIKINELQQALLAQERTYQQKEDDLYLNFFEVLDAFDILEQTIQAKEDQLDKTSRRLAKSMRSIAKKIHRFLNEHHIVQLAFSDQKAKIDLCRVVDTEPHEDKDNETIIQIVKHGYINETTNTVIRKADVITVLND